MAEKAAGGRQSGVAVGEVEVKRWRRYGKDRLYVNSEDGKPLGWYDVQTGEMHVAVAARSQQIERAIEAWRAANDPGDHSPDPARESTVPVSADAVTQDGGQAATRLPTDRSEVHDDKDLVWHQAGSMAQQQALALERDAPVRTWVARLSGAHTEERAWRIGAHGEKLVAERLISLRRKDPSWGFLHAIPVGERGSDIDHLVVGPGGVFTLNTKNHPGRRIWVGGDTVMVNGHRVPYVRNSRYEAQRAARLLGRAAGMHVAVVPLLVFVGIPDIAIATAPIGVHILRVWSLVDWFLRLPPVLERPAIEAVYGVARKASTWKLDNPRER